MSPLHKNISLGMHSIFFLLSAVKFNSSCSIISFFYSLFVVVVTFAVREHPKLCVSARASSHVPCFSAFSFNSRHKTEKKFTIKKRMKSNKHTCTNSVCIFHLQGKKWIFVTMSTKRK